VFTPSYQVNLTYPFDYYCTLIKRKKRVSQWGSNPDEVFPLSHQVNLTYPFDYYCTLIKKKKRMSQWGPNPDEVFPLFYQVNLKEKKNVSVRFEPG
jgi:hypothetical protein